MSEVLEWDYSSGEPGDLFYPMNGTGDLDEEGYGQLMPIAAAEYAGADSVTVMPASSYNAANERDPGEVQQTLDEGLQRLKVSVFLGWDEEFSGLDGRFLRFTIGTREQMEEVENWFKILEQKLSQEEVKK